MSEAHTKAASRRAADREALPLSPSTHRYAAAFLVDGRVIARATSTTEKRAIRQAQEAARRLPASSFAGAVLRTRPLRPEELRAAPGRQSQKTLTNRDLLRKIQLFAGPLYLSKDRGPGGGVLLQRDHLLSILGRDPDGPACARFSIRHGKGCLTLAKLEQEGTATPRSKITGLLLGSCCTRSEAIPCDRPISPGSAKSVSRDSSCEINNRRSAS